MPVPGWVKGNSIYPRARAAALSLRGSERFYNPVSAAALCVSEEEGHPPAFLELDEIQAVRRQDGLTIWHTPFGELATMDTEITEHIGFLVAEFQRTVYLSGPAQVRPGAIVLDVGANIGLFTMQASRAGAERVIAIEPTPGTRHALCWNLASEISAGRVTVLGVGAWDAIDTLRITVDPKRPGRSSMLCRPGDEAAYDVSVEVEPLDHCVEKLNLPHIDFIKMDIEGAELHALRGAREILRRDKPQLAIAVEHTADRIANAKMVRELVLSVNPEYRCTAGPYVVTKERRLAPEVLYFV